MLTQEQIEALANESRASQNKIELKKVLRYAGDIDPKVVVEIGVHQGYSMEVWNKAFKPDILIGLENDCQFLKQEALQPPCAVLDIDSHKQESVAELEAWLKGREIDFLFIDGDHTYNGVARDFELYAPLVRKGGIVGFHDIMLDSNEWRAAGVDVAKFWTELISATGSSYFTFWDEQGKGTGTGLWVKK